MSVNEVQQTKTGSLSTVISLSNNVLFDPSYR